MYHYCPCFIEAFIYSFRLEQSKNHFSSVQLTKRGTDTLQNKTDKKSSSQKRFKNTIQQTSTNMSYENIISGSKGVATPSPKARAGWRSHPDFGPCGLLRAWAQPLTFSAKKTTLILDEECPDLFATKLANKTVMQITIKANGHPSLPGHIIRSLISPHQVQLLNYGRADTWYFATDTSEAVDLNNKIITHGPYTLEITRTKSTVCSGGSIPP